MWHGYWGIENLALNDTQRDTIVDELRRLGPSSDPQPARLNHWRTRLDGQAAIFEALWDEQYITIDTFKQRLAALFNIDPETIDHDTNLVTFAARQSAVVTFSRNGTDYLRTVFFGYAGGEFPEWDESGDEARAYLALFADEWEPEGE